MSFDLIAVLARFYFPTGGHGDIEFDGGHLWRGRDDLLGQDFVRVRRRGGRSPYGPRRRLEDAMAKKMVAPVVEEHKSEPPPEPMGVRPGTGAGLTLQEMKDYAKQLARDLGHEMGPFVLMPREMGTTREPAYRSRCERCRFRSLFVSPQRFADKNRFMGGLALRDACSGETPNLAAPEKPAKEVEASRDDIPAPDAGRDEPPTPNEEQGKENDMTKQRSKRKAKEAIRTARKGTTSTKRDGTQRRGKRVRVFDKYAVTAVIRWMGKKQFTKEEAAEALKALGVKSTPATIASYLYSGPEPAKLDSAEQAKLLRHHKA